MPDYQPPQGWSFSAIQDLISSDGVVSDGDWVESKDQDPNGSIRLIQLADIGDGDFRNKSQRFMSEDKAALLNCTFLRKGDVLIARMPDPLGRACLFPGVGQPAVTVVDVCLIRGGSCSVLNSRLLKYWINSPNFRGLIAENASGTTRKRITRKKLEKFELPVPPLPEQAVIADKLDTLLAQVQNTKARLERIPQILKRFRQSVLAAAVSGRLTEELTSTGVELREIAEFQNGYAFKSGWFENSGTHQVVKLGNIRDGHIALDNSPAYVGDELANEFSRYSPSPGDILISMTGTRFKKDYGFGCIIKDEKNLLINQRVGRVIPDRSKVSPEFLSLFVRSDVFRNQFFAGETGGVNQGNVGSKHILSILVQLPTIGAQKEIVRQVDQLFAHADRIEQQVNNALARVNNLTQSILAKAFRGELTEQWRKDNPELISGENSAEALLERIKAERAVPKPAKKAQKKVSS